MTTNKRRLLSTSNTILSASLATAGKIEERAMKDNPVERIAPYYLRRMEDSTLVNNDGLDDFLVACESEFTYQEVWGGLRHDHYAQFLAQYCQTNPGEACQQQESNFWNLDLRLQKIFMSPGCPQDTDLNEQCIDYFLQNNPQTLIYAGSVTQLCELTEDLLITTGLMLPIIDNGGDLGQDGRDSGNPPVNISITSTQSPSHVPSTNLPDPTSEKQESDEKDIVSRQLMAFLAVLVICGLVLGMVLAYIRRLRYKRKKASVVENSKGLVHGVDRTRMPPRVPCPAAKKKGPSCVSSSSSRGNHPRAAPLHFAVETASMSQIPQNHLKLAPATSSLPQRKQLTPQKSTSSELAQSVDEEEIIFHSEPVRETAETHTNTSEWIVECTEEEENLNLASLRCELNSVSSFQHFQFIGVDGDHRVSDLKSGTVEASEIFLERPIHSTREEDAHEIQGSMELQSTKPFNCSTTKNCPSADSPAFCEVIDLVQDTSHPKSEYIPSLTVSCDSAEDFESLKQEIVSSTLSVRSEEESLYATRCGDAKDDWAVGLVETIPEASISAHAISFPVLRDSTSNMDPSEHDVYSSTASADNIDESIRAALRRNSRTVKVLHNSSRTGADPPDDDAVNGHRSTNDESVDRAPELCKVKLSQSSDFDLMSTSAISCSSELSIDSPTAMPNTQLVPNVMNTDAISNHSDIQTTVSALPDFDIVSTGGRSELSVRSWCGTSETGLHHVSSADEISIDATSDASRDSIAPMYAISQTMLSQQPNTDDISMDMQSCNSSQFSSEGYYYAKPQVKSKRLSGRDGMSMDTSSHSIEWSMEGSIRQTFDSFKEKVSHAIADLNEDMNTVDTTSSLRDSELAEENTPTHRICGLDP